MSSRWMDEESGKLVQEEGLANMKASGKGRAEQEMQEGLDGGGRESEEPGTGSLMQDFTGFAKDLGLSPKSHGKSLQGLKWGLTIYI